MNDDQWDEVEFQLGGITRDEIEKDADAAMKQLAGDAEYRFELRIQGLNRMAGAPTSWVADVRGTIRSAR